MKLSRHILLLALLTTAVSGFGGYFLAQYHEKSQHEVIEKILTNTIYQSLQDTLAHDGGDGNKLQVTRVLKKLKNNNVFIEYLYITNTRSSGIFSHSFEKDIPSYLLLDSETGGENYINQSGMVLTRQAQTDSGLISVYAKRLQPGSERALHIGINRSLVLEQLGRNKIDILMIGLSLALLVMIIAYWLSKKITDPLVGFVEQLNLIDEGETVDFNCIKTSTSEVKQLACAFQESLSKRQQTIKALEEREQNLTLTLASIGDAVITTDEKGSVTRMNPVAEKLTGWSFKEAKGESLKTIFPIVNASTREPIENPADKVLVSGETLYLSNHTTLIAKDNNEYQISDSAAPIRDSDNQILGMVLVFNDVTEAYRLRERAKTAHQQLQGLLDDMQTMVVITEIDGAVNFSNNTPLKASGVELRDVLGRKIWNCVWFNYDQKVQNIIINDCTEAWKGKHILRDIQISTPNGLMWVTYSIHPVLNADGNTIQLLHEGRDISARKKIEDDIYQSSQQLKLYREQAPLATIEWNTDFQVVNWNAAAESMFGYSFNEVKGRNFSDIMLPKNTVSDIKALWENIISKSSRVKSINENTTKNGNIILCEWHNTPLIDESGQLIGAASLVLDITAQHEAQQLLLLKEHEQRDILNTMVDAVISVDETGIILSFNKSAELLFGYNAEKIVGQNVALLIPKPIAGEHDRYFKSYFKTGYPHVIGASREVEVWNKNKQTFPIRLSVAELPDDGSGKHRFIGTCHDLKNIKKQEEQLRRSQKMDALGKLTGGIAHDYNNMLGVVLGYSDLLKSLLKDQPKLADYVDQIHHAGERGARLTKKLLSFSQENSAETVILNINTLLQEQQDMLQKTLTVRIKLTIDLAEEAWLVRLDSGDLEDAILNMSINAMHAIEDGGTLTIRTCNQSLNTKDARQLNLKAGDYVLLSVTDTGCGMDEECLQKLFDPFYSTKGDRGTGLGLSQVFGFTKRSDGAIKVYSELGHGSQFILYFPRYREDGVDRITETSENNINLSGKETILIVDDEKALRNITSELISRQGYQTFCAESGKRALTILEHEDIDLMLSDIIMPEMSGYQLAAIVQEKYPKIKIQLASGFSDERHIGMVNESLHRNVLLKPYTSQALFKSIRTLLDGEPYDK